MNIAEQANTGYKYEPIISKSEHFSMQCQQADLNAQIIFKA